MVPFLNSYNGVLMSNRKREAECRMLVNINYTVTFRNFIQMLFAFKINNLLLRINFARRSACVVTSHWTGKSSHLKSVPNLLLKT